MLRESRSSQNSGCNTNRTGPRLSDVLMPFGLSSAVMMGEGRQVRTGAAAQLLQTRRSPTRSRELCLH